MACIVQFELFDIHIILIPHFRLRADEPRGGRADDGGGGEQDGPGGGASGAGRHCQELRCLHRCFILRDLCP